EGRAPRLTPLAIGGLGNENPPSPPGRVGPGSPCSKVHGDCTSIATGGSAAVLLQACHALDPAGGCGRAHLRQDLLGRLRRTGQFVSGATFGSRVDAQRLIERVRTIHLQVAGHAPDGRPYAASDPDLLTWVHVAEVSSFLKAHLRYLNPELPGSEQDRYYAEVARIAEALGARDVPRSRNEVANYFQTLRPQLQCDERSQEVLRILLNAPAPSALAKPFGALMMQAGIELLPDWASEQFRLQQGSRQRQLIRLGVRCTAPLLRWAVRNGSVHRARRRMGLPLHSPR